MVAAIDNSIRHMHMHMHIYLVSADDHSSTHHDRLSPDPAQYRLLPTK